MRRQIARLIHGTLRLRILLAALLLGLLALFDFSINRAQEQQGRRTFINVTADCAYPNWGEDGESSIKINSLEVKLNDRGQPAIASTLDYPKLTPGTYQISVHTPHFKGKVSKVDLSSPPHYDKAGEFEADASGIATVTLNDGFWGPPEERASPYINIRVSCGDKGKEESNLKEHKVAVRVKTLECDKTDLANYSVKIEGNLVKFNMTEGAYDVPIKEGKNRISISVSDYPDAKINMATVVSHGGEKSFDKSADELGQIELMLEPDLFTGKPVIPGNQIIIHLYTVGDCPPDYEPPLQRLDAPPRIKVASVKGNVTVFRDHSDDESPVTVGSMIEDQQIIRTRPDARVELVASDKRLFILKGGTVAKFNIRKKQDGTWEVDAEQRAGSIEVRHVRWDRHGLKGYEWKIITPTATIADKDTFYTVIYNEDSKGTSVEVEQGQVIVTPTNTSLNPITLAAHQTVDVFENRVSTVSPYLNAGDSKGSLSKESGGLFDRPILLVGLGAAALVGLLVVVAGISFLYRRANRSPVQPAFQQSGMKVEATPANLATPQRMANLASPAVGTNVATNVATNEWRCPNPQCGKLVPASKKFCTACGGTQSGVKAEARAVNIASPAVATNDWRCPNPQCGKLVPAAKKFCTACGTPVIGRPPNPGPIVT